jgi:3-oxoacyl-[acyl-carrier-protein] synthase-3
MVEEQLNYISAPFKIPKGSIRMMTGIDGRHYGRDEGPSSFMATNAAKMALEKAELLPEQIDTLIFASATHDIAEPATANILQCNLGTWNAHVLDVKNACNSFLNALDISNSLIQTGRSKRILIASGEVLSGLINWKVDSASDLKTKFAAFTLGDAGGAVVLEAHDVDDGRGVGTGHFMSDGSYWDKSVVMGGGTLQGASIEGMFFQCDSGKLQDLAVHHLPKFAEMYRGELGWSGKDDIALVVPHQVSIGVVNALAGIFDFPIEKCAITLRTCGNTAAASIPLALSIAVEEGRVKKEDKILLVGGAAGFSAGYIPVVW